MSSLAAAKADNFYYPPDFDPKKHQTLNKYNGQHPLRERASKLDQGILVIRFEIPFNIWCDKCGEHIAKGERFNAEKKAIGQYHSTKILQFTMMHHCGCKITIQTDPKRAEYLVVEGARKKEESYSAADAEVIELPDEEERERRQRDPLYRLEYQQGAKVKALSGAERLAAIHDAVDARAADPYSVNRALRAALRSEKRSAAVLDARRQELGLPDAVPLLAPSDGDVLAAQVAFLTSSARATAGAEAHRKRILEQDIFAASGAKGGVPGTGAATQGQAPGAAAATAGGAPPQGCGGATGLAAAAQLPPAKRPALGLLPVKIRGVAPPGAAASGQAGEQGSSSAQRLQGQSPPQEPGQHQEQPQPLQGQGQPSETSRVATQEEPRVGVCVAGTSGGPCEVGARAATGAFREPTGGRTSGVPSSSLAASTSGGGRGSGNSSGQSSGRPPPGAAALAAAAARAATLAQASRSAPHPQTVAKSAGLHSAGSARGSLPVHLAGRSQGSAPASYGGGGAIGVQKRSIKDRAAELQKRRQGLGGVGLALNQPEL